ncbi:MAG: heme exporter protein CcmD [Rhodospirillales bacterium]
MSAFLDMGGYAVFVWPSYGLSAVVLIGLLVASLRGRRRQLDAVARLEADADAP